MAREIPVDLTKTGGSLTAALGIKDPHQPPPPAGVPAPPKPASEAEKAKAEPPAEPEKPQCKQCGLDPTKGLDHCTAADELDFAKFIFRGELFKKEYRLFGDAVVVTFRDVTPAEASDILAILDKEQAQDKFPPGLQGLGLRFDRSLSLRLGLSVERISLGGPVAVPKHESFDAAHDWLVALCKSEMVYRGVRNAYIRFSNLLAELGRKALDPSFSRATAGGG